ncbi:MAG: thymidine phosphorylase, partial [Candidatus Hydrothermarchaeota archaeon]|nr:thymidine phosphorylase [Candidatus Hydrothermarchaeota archaeon]
HSTEEGYVTQILNQAMVQIARAAGAPKDKGAGISLNIAKGIKVKEGDLLFEIYAESKYKLAQAEKLARHMHPVILEGMLLRRISEYIILDR